MDSMKGETIESEMDTVPAYRMMCLEAEMGLDLMVTEINLCF